ncbi:MAG: hypothetical protein ACRDMA_17960 [Solirubrobacterales bacterium]
MEGVRHRLGDDAASVPRIVLPITSRGLPVTDRLCWGVLAAAMAAAAALMLYLNRGTTFFVDELIWVYDSPDTGVGDLLDPYNGNLIAVTRLAYKAILETIGPEYLAFRLLGVAALLLSSGFLYALARRRIGSLPALAPAIVLLFLGSAWQYVVVPLGFSALFSIAAGLAALLVLERGDRRGDVAACALVVLSVATFSTGLLFCVGVAISVFLRPDRWRRAWIFLVPLVLYGAWWLSVMDSVQDPGAQAKLPNALLIPGYAADSLAAAVGALVGLDFSFTVPQPQHQVELGWGRVLAAVAVIALVARIGRGNVRTSLWASLGILVTFFVLGGLAFSEIRPPALGRYTLIGAVGVLLVAIDAARGVTFSKLGLIALFAVATVSLATNLALLRDGAASFREGYTRPVRATFTMLELARAHVRPDFNPRAALANPPPHPMPVPPYDYLQAADRYGSLGYSLAELARQSEVVRGGADQVLAKALDLELGGTRTDPPAKECRALPSQEGTVELPPGGATLRLSSGDPAPVTLGRFADTPTIGVGNLAPGEPTMLQIPMDASSEPWRTAVAATGPVEICALR